MTERKIYVAMPFYDKIPGPCVESLFRMPRPHTVQWNGEACCNRARNVMSAAFLRSECTHLLFIDSDIIFTTNDYLRITSHNEPLVCGVYPLRKRDQLVWCVNDVHGPKPEIRPDGLREVRYAGTGFMCIAREVFQKMLEADEKEIAYRVDETGDRIDWDFWRMGVYNTEDWGGCRRYLTEDFFFCQRWRELGGKVWIDSKVILQHIGLCTWPLPHHVEVAKQKQLERRAATRPIGEVPPPPAAAPATPQPEPQA